MQLIFHMNVRDVPVALCVGEVAWSLQGVLYWLKYSVRILPGFPNSKCPATYNKVLKLNYF